MSATKVQQENPKLMEKNNSGEEKDWLWMT